MTIVCILYSYSLTNMAAVRNLYKDFCLEAITLEAKAYEYFCVLKFTNMAAVRNI
jgi:hypothetical protein